MNLMHSTTLTRYTNPFSEVMKEKEVVQLDDFNVPGGRNIDDWRRGCRRWSPPERTTKQMVWLPNHHSVTYRWPCWQQSQRRSYDGLIWRILKKKNWYDVTSWWLRHVWDTKLIEIIKTVCKWRQRQHCLSQYSRRRSRRVYQYDLKNRVREHD